MRIITVGVILGCLAVLAQSADEHRPKKKEKRNLQYSISHHYSAPNYRLERRISNGQQQQQYPSNYPPSQYYPGPPRPYRKDNGPDLTDSNHLSDPIDRGGSGDTIYIPHKPLIKVVEKPVYIKEPEPIIEIIIKESNISLPPPPTEAPPPPQKKKKEEVQVFYVKYKKNPNGYGKDAVIYDKPIPAISPPIPDEEPEPEYESAEKWNEEPGYDSYANEVTEPPRPSTTLRTIIKPDSEVYHSPGNNVKVTFGKEGFDYDKRSSKPEDYPGPPSPSHEDQYARARQLSSFSDVYFKRPSPNYYQSSSNEYRSEVRPPQSYRPFNSFPPSSNQHSSRSPNREFNNRPPSSFFPPQKYPFQSPPYTKPSSNSQSTNFASPSQSSKSSFPNFSHSISHPPPPQFQSQTRKKYSQPVHQSLPHQYQSQPSFNDVPPPNQRKPVPYTPFENLRPSQPSFSQPLSSPHESHQSFSQPSSSQHHEPHQSFSQPSSSQPASHHQTSPQLPQVKQHIQFRPETRLNIQTQLPVSRPPQSFDDTNNRYQTIDQSQQQLYQNVNNQNQQNFNQHHVQVQTRHEPTSQSNEQLFQEHINNLRTAQNVLPPGGELVQSLPKYEQHIVESSAEQPRQTLPLQTRSQSSFSASSQQSFDNLIRANKQGKSQGAPPPQYISQQNLQHIINNQQQFDSNKLYENQRFAENTTPRLATYRSHSPTTPKPTTTTREPEKPSTTTKDPKILTAQLPDEVPDDLREQLLSSGILNNADISILDYDKVGDIPLSALPPDQLANFYGAGGAAQLASAGSEPIPQVAALTSRRVFVGSQQDQEMEAEETEVKEVLANPSGENVELKVVKYDPTSDQGQKVQEAYINDDAKQVDPVVLNDNSYNRYLPLKVNGTQFPIPEVPELKGKQISSVVVLAPISYDFSSNRPTREANPKSDIDFIKNDPLKALLANPTHENYKKFLEHENNTAASKQSVVLLIAGSNENPSAEKEIFMYDIASKTVSKLSGELSSAFVEAAEANSSDEIAEHASAASDVVETKIPSGSSKPTDDLHSDGTENFHFISKPDHNRVKKEVEHIKDEKM